ncbi:MAG TPA: potassium transporter TrkG [Candidatus Deferrimicrobiaceae bacterium]|nr:potassium transporter TrkG [Candidatus Deferrimicrobiaceae bacterium]
MAGFAFLIAIGTVVLILPISSASGAWTDPIVALFTATSAVCVTGLIVVDTGTYWSGFGHGVILLLLQVGGFGFMTGSTLLLLLLVGRRTGLRDRVLVQASTDTANLGQVTSLVKRVAAFTLVAEVVGAIALALAFAARGQDLLGAGWWGVFHSISAFNNAGFDLVGEFRSLSPYRDDPLVLIPVGILIVLGGLGFAIVGDAVAKRRWRRWALETKLVLPTTVALIAAGTLAIGWFDWDNPATLGALPPEQRPLNALFEAVTLRTAGFSTLPTGSLTSATLFAVIALMYIGGASGSTTGGIKVNTFVVLLVAIVSTARGLPSATAFGRRISHVLVYRALSIALLGIAVVFLVGLGLEVIGAGSFTFVQGLFEAVSAVGTVGASTGITRELADPARLLIVFAMFVGRLGPLTLVVALAARARPVSHRPAVESLRIG